jgi:hypothetical protein
MGVIRPEARFTCSSLSFGVIWGRCAAAPAIGESDWCVDVDCESFLFFISPFRRGAILAPKR